VLSLGSELTTMLVVLAFHFHKDIFPDFWFHQLYSMDEFSRKTFNLLVPSATRILRMEPTEFS
jgi:hypothetical protein